MGRTSRFLACGYGDLNRGGWTASHPQSNATISFGKTSTGVACGHGVRNGLGSSGFQPHVPARTPGSVSGFVASWIGSRKGGGRDCSHPQSPYG